jgi:hypothetical protein
MAQTRCAQSFKIGELLDRRARGISSASFLALNRRSSCCALPCPPPLAGEVAAKLTEGGTVEVPHCKSPLSRVPRQLPRKQGSKPCPPPLAGEVAAKLTEGGTRNHCHCKSPLSRVPRQLPRWSSMPMPMTAHLRTKNAPTFRSGRSLD